MINLYKLSGLHIWFHLCLKTVFSWTHAQFFQNPKNSDFLWPTSYITVSLSSGRGRTTIDVFLHLPTWDCMFSVVIQHLVVDKFIQIILPINICKGRIMTLDVANTSNTFICWADHYVSFYRHRFQKNFKMLIRKIFCGSFVNVWIFLLESKTLFFHANGPLREVSGRLSNEPHENWSMCSVSIIRLNSLDECTSQSMSYAFSIWNFVVGRKWSWLQRDKLAHIIFRWNGHIKCTPRLVCL